ncbi:MAG: hypothetical protein OXC60_02710 [Litoreibacter sp.]|nr:hypothetical protein [Litoreibacter sp.]
MLLLSVLKRVQMFCIAFTLSAGALSATGLLIAEQDRERAKSEARVLAALGARSLTAGGF